MFEYAGDIITHQGTLFFSSSSHCGDQSMYLDDVHGSSVVFEDPVGLLLASSVPQFHHGSDPLMVDKLSQTGRYSLRDDLEREAPELPNTYASRDGRHRGSASRNVQQCSPSTDTHNHTTQHGQSSVLAPVPDQNHLFEQVHVVEALAQGQGLY